VGPAGRHHHQSQPGRQNGKTFGAVLREIVEIVPGPVSAEVTALDMQGMLDQAHEYADIASNIVVKIPLILRD
jgi:transaldolase